MQSPVWQHSRRRIADYRSVLVCGNARGQAVRGEKTAVNAFLLGGRDELFMVVLAVLVTT